MLKQTGMDKRTAEKRSDPRSETTTFTQTMVHHQESSGGCPKPSWKCMDRIAKSYRGVGDEGSFTGLFLW